MIDKENDSKKFEIDNWALGAEMFTQSLLIINFVINHDKWIEQIITQQKAPEELIHSLIITGLVLMETIKTLYGTQSPYYIPEIEIEI